MRTLLIFICLQFADFGTTAAALKLGAAEQNPLVAHIMGIGTVEGLIVAKLIATALAGAAALAGKYAGLRLGNLIFTAIVTWNSIIIAALLFQA